MESSNNSANKNEMQGVLITSADFYRLPDNCRRINDGYPEVLISDSSQGRFARAIIKH